MTTPALRKIEPLKLPPEMPIATEFGKRPRLEWLAPTSLSVDATYQRELAKESFALIKRLVANFRWNRVKPIIAVDVGAGVFHIIDGQHTAIAAATLSIATVPVFIVEATTIAERAGAFVGHNTDRIKVGALVIHRALFAAGDPDATDVENVCRRARVRLRTFNAASAVSEGDTMAIGSIKQLVKRYGVRKARIVLEALVKAQRTPIASADILAAALILLEGEEPPSADELVPIIRRDGPEGFLAARGTAAKVKRPVRDVLADRWRRQLAEVRK